MTSGFQFTQSIVADRESNLADIRQTVNVATQKPIFFKIELIKPIDDPFACFHDVSDKPESIKSGATYTVRVSTTFHKVSNQQSFLIQSDIKLAIGLKLEIGSIRLTEKCIEVSKEDIETFSKTFQMIVDQNCPSLELSLLLAFREKENHREGWKPAAELYFSVEGTYNFKNEELLKSCYLDLDVTLPKNVAILHIESPQINQFRISGWSHFGKPYHANLVNAVTIKLSDFIKEQMHPESIRTEIRAFSRQGCPEDLLKWLKQLYTLHGEKLVVVIFDQSEHEFPWEMLEVLDGKYLGSIATVARWAGIRFYTEWRYLKIANEQISSKVIAYLDRTGISASNEEKLALAPLNPQYCGTVNRLKQALSKTLTTVGLVYLSCRGIFTHSPKHKEVVSSFSNPCNHTVEIQFESINNQQGSRPIFFVNSPHSARLLRRGSERCGLPEVILARVADGYIGTLGFVEPAYALEVAKKIINASYQDKNGIQPADILRQLRAEAVEALQADETPENWNRFIYRFMYVYYGNPLTKLQLVKAIDGEQSS